MSSIRFSRSKPRKTSHILYSIIDLQILPATAMHLTQDFPQKRRSLEHLPRQAETFQKDTLEQARYTNPLASRTAVNVPTFLADAASNLSPCSTGCE